MSGMEEGTDDYVALSSTPYPTLRRLKSSCSTPEFTGVARLFAQRPECEANEVEAERAKICENLLEYTNIVAAILVEKRGCIHKSKALK